MSEIGEGDGKQLKKITENISMPHMYYIYLLFWLSRHCGWFVWGAPLHVPRPEEDDVCIG